MNAVIVVQQPLPTVESLRVYKRFRGESNYWIYPIKLNGTLSSIRINKNAMWIEKLLADTYSDEVWNFIGNIITTNRLL